MVERKTQIIFWLWIIVVMTVGMVVLGGITRLTGSGLSMVDWRPLMGVIPPTNEADWNKVFEMYKQFPEYQIINRQMTLSEFKSIYFWEYMHRMMGRMIGLVFLLPWIFFNIKKRLTRNLNLKLLALFVLLAVQGVFGWYMVQSGLADRPQVSHYRLAVHLCLAMAMLGATLYQVLNLIRGMPAEKPAVSPRLRNLALAFTGLVSLQIFYGALVAGLDAGFAYSTFPKMAGHWVPPHMFALEPAWRNLFDNHTTVQFLHRTFGWLILFGVAGIWLYARRFELIPGQSRGLYILTGVVALQFLFGILTVVYVVPLALAVTHQLFAAILFAAAINVNHALRE